MDHDLVTNGKGRSIALHPEWMTMFMYLRGLGGGNDLDE